MLLGSWNKWLDDNSSISFSHEHLSNQRWKRGFGKYKSKYKKVAVLPIRIVKSNVSSVRPFVREKHGETRCFSLTKGFTIRIGSTPTFLYFELYLYTAYAIHYVYFTFDKYSRLSPFRSCARDLGIATLTMHDGTVFRDELYVSVLR